MFLLRKADQTMQDFTHVSNFPDYMKKVARFITNQGKRGNKVLDLPAGNGLFADRLKTQGFDVTCGDINSERSEYVHTNMEALLPFEDCTFDFVTCMEGVEHVINPSQLISELARITKHDGHVVITMPNVQNIYSRLKFLFTGVFYQFEPEFLRHPNGRLIDRGHISSLTYTQLNYIFVEAGLTPVLIDGDKFKKKILMPLYLVLGFINLFIYQLKKRTNPELMPYHLMMSSKFLLSRSLIAVWKK